MLNMIKLSEVVKPEVIVDTYIPIKLKWGEWNIVEEQTYYWRTGDFKQSLLEIGFASKSGLIRSLTLVTVKNIFLNSNKQLDLNLPQSDGVPMFDIKEWENKRRIDEEGKLAVHLTGNAIYIFFSDKAISNRVMTERVCLGFDDNDSLCVVGVLDLNSNEISEIRQSLEFKIKELSR